jgi:hypothetical protein
MANCQPHQAVEAAKRKGAVQPCARGYQVDVRVVTRAGEIPMRGVEVRLDDERLGVTDEQGRAKSSKLREDGSVLIEAIFENDDEPVKRETFRLRIEAIDADAGTFAAGSSRNEIPKVRDVLGTGSSALPGDVDFIDEYPTNLRDVTLDASSGRLSVLIRMATFSLQVPYRNQNDGSETIDIGKGRRSEAMRGSRLCMPTSEEMQLAYWDVRKSSGEAVSRRDIMQGTYSASRGKSIDFPAPWQRWGEVHAWTSKIVGSSLEVQSGPSNLELPPSAGADSLLKDCLVKGLPVILSIVGGHIILIRGAVVNHEGRVRWLIFNDPYGNFSSPDSVYADLSLKASVGDGGVNQPGDVSAVQDVLRSLGFFNGAVDGRCGADTIEAIRRYQGPSPTGRIDPKSPTERTLNRALAGRDNSWYTGEAGEKERNTPAGEGSARGRHAYYDSTTESRSSDSAKVERAGHMRFKGPANSMVLVRSPPLTKDEVAARLTPGRPRA